MTDVSAYPPGLPRPESGVHGMCPDGFLSVGKVLRDLFPSRRLADTPRLFRVADGRPRRRPAGSADRHPGPACGLAAAAVLLAGGCTHNPFRTAPPATLSQQAAGAPGPLATPVAPVPSYADVDGRQLEASLVRSRQETQLLQEEIGVLREQLASTSTQLAQARAVGPAPPPAPAASTDVATTPATMQSAMTQLSLPGVDSRLDGGVVRLDIPADRLFEEGGASIVPGGAAILTQVAGELDRLFPGHFVGIEGHVDTTPTQGSWGSSHQLTAARSAAVFDFFTGHTSMRAGQLFLVAHGPNHPLVSNATAAGRARNRRIEVVVYPERATPAKP